LGIGLVLTVILNPEGIVGPIHVLLDRRRTRSAAPSRTPSPPIHLVEPAPAVAPEPSLLSPHDVHVQYGGVVAVDGVSFDVPRGTIVGLIGPNGAGKTTLLDAISGFAQATGTIMLAGQPLQGLAPHQRIRAGLGRTFQHIELYDDLSVQENVVVGLAARGRRASTDDLAATFDLLELGDVAGRPAGELSQGRRQLVSIARALVASPTVLLLDEPAGGLDTSESEWLGDRLRSIRDSGVTILLIDHDMHLVLNLCDEVHVLNFGRLIASGPPAAVKANRNVAEAYLGATHATQTTVVG
jgi:ABC-type branched-subunit amino acid transport system ATPase component